MKILMVTNNYPDRSRGGVELHVYNLANALVAAGNEVVVVRTTPGPRRYQLDDIVPVWVLFPAVQPLGSEEKSRYRRVPLARALVNFLDRYRLGLRAAKALLAHQDTVRTFDVVHHHDFITSAVISRRLKALNVSQIWTNHLGEFLVISRLPGFGKWLTRTMTRTFARGIGPSHELADQSAVACPMTYIPNGVDTGLFRPLSAIARDSMRARRGWSEDEVVCVVPRRWAPGKGVLYAAQAVSLDSWPRSCRVVFAGAAETGFPEYAASIRDALSGSNVSHEIIDSLSPKDMAAILQCADISIIPSLMEATSLSALESMAVGVPIVASNVGGMPEIVEKGRSGLLIPPKDSQAIAEAVKCLSGYESRGRMQMGEIGRTLVASTYSWSIIARRTLAIYSEVI